MILSYVRNVHVVPNLTFPWLPHHHHRSSWHGKSHAPRCRGRPRGLLTWDWWQVSTNNSLFCGLYDLNFSLNEDYEMMPVKRARGGFGHALRIRRGDEAFSHALRIRASPYGHALRIKKGGNYNHALRIRASPYGHALRIKKGDQMFSHALRIRASPLQHALRVRRAEAAADPDYDLEDSVRPIFR